MRTKKQTITAKAHAILGKNYRPLRLSTVPPRGFDTLEGVGVFLAWNEGGRTKNAPLTTLDDPKQIQQLRQQLQLPEAFRNTEEHETDGNRYTFRPQLPAAWARFFGSLASALRKIKAATYYITNQIDVTITVGESLSLTLAATDEQGNPVTLPDGYVIAATAKNASGATTYEASTADGTIEKTTETTYTLTVPPQHDGLLTVQLRFGTDEKQVDAHRTYNIMVVDDR